VFVPVKPFQPYLVFRDKHHSLLGQSYKTRGPHNRMAPFFTSNISVIYKMTRGLIIKLITAVIYRFRNKLVFVPVKPCLVFRDKHHSLLSQSYKTRALHNRMAPFFTSKFYVIYKMTRGLYYKTYCGRNLKKKVFKSGISV
jgi:hypothetical protein